LVCHAAESQGTEHAARARELCGLRVVGLAVFGADCAFNLRRFGLERIGRKTSANERQKVGENLGIHLCADRQ